MNSQVLIDRELLQDLIDGSGMSEYCTDSVVDEATRLLATPTPIPDAGELERLVTEHVKHAYYERKTITEAVGEIVSALQASAMAKMEGADRYTCIGKGGIYARVGTSLGAGECRGEIIEVYRDAENGQLYHRESGDFFARMLAASPSAKGGE